MLLLEDLFWHNLQAGEPSPQCPALLYTIRPYPCSPPCYCTRCPPCALVSPAPPPSLPITAPMRTHTGGL